MDTGKRVTEVNLKGQNLKTKKKQGKCRREYSFSVHPEPATLPHTLPL